MAKIKPAQKTRADRSLERYLEEIGNYEPLPPEREIELARRIKRNDPQALEELVKANLRFVVSVAKEYQHQGLPMEDLINEGNLGLIKAAQRFDETRGFKFISYAVWWIRQSILQALAEQSRIVRLPLNRIGTLNKIGKMLETLGQQYEREPALEELAQHLNMTSREITETIKTSARHISLDAPMQPGDGDSNSLLDVVQNEEIPSPDNDLMRESLRADLDQVLSTLSWREAKILKLYFGIDQERPYTLEEIGEIFNLTRERVRQIKEKALRKLRHKSRCKTLQQYLG
jgi:RNA polymerase primary sigma factor